MPQGRKREILDALATGGIESCPSVESEAYLEGEDRVALTAVVGLLNDYAQMLDDGLPYHFIFQQYHIGILRCGALLAPYIAEHHTPEALMNGRWGMRVPVMVRRAEIYHEMHWKHRDGSVRLERRLLLDGLPSDLASPDPLCRHTHAVLRFEVLSQLAASPRHGIYGSDGEFRPLPERWNEGEFRTQIRAWLDGLPSPA